MAKYLVIAPGGMLGRAWVELLEVAGADWVGVGRPDFDLRDEAQVRAAVRGHSVVINCAAYTDVDGAEAQEQEATRVNGVGVGNLARACGRAALLVHYSTDYVFDGRASEPYPVDHPACPINAYGRSKAAGEAALQAAHCPYLLIRTSWLYAPWGDNFVNTMVRLTATRTTLKVVDDQRGRPTSAQHLASSTLALLEAGARGIYHVSDGGQCSWYELAVAIRDRVGGGAEISPCTSLEFRRPAPRPRYSVLDLQRTEAVIGKMPHWRDNLDRVLERRSPEG